MDRRLPPLNALRAFEAAGRHESFSLAAEELHVTHAAISHQVKALERWLNTPLFKRMTRAVRLTAAGRSYLPAIEGAFNQIDASTASLNAARRDAPLHVTTTPAFAMRWLAPRLGGLWETHPDLDLRLHEHHWLEGVDLMASDVDVTVRIGAQHSAGVTCEPLLPGTVTPMCSPMLLRDAVALENPEDLLRFKLLHAYEYRPWREWFQRAGVEDSDISLGPIFDDTNLIYAAALSGQGVGLIHTALVKEELAAGQLVQLFPAEARADLGYHLHFRTAESNVSNVAKFREWLQRMVDNTD